MWFWRAHSLPTRWGGRNRGQHENVKGGCERSHALYKNNIDANMCIMQNIVLATEQMAPAYRHSNRRSLNCKLSATWRNMEIEQRRENSRLMNPLFAHGESWERRYDKSRRPVCELGARRSVSTVPIRLKALTLVEEIKIEHKGGPSYWFCFMKRCHLFIWTAEVQLPSEDHNKKNCPSSAPAAVKTLSTNTSSWATGLTWTRCSSLLI